MPYHLPIKQVEQSKSCGRHFTRYDIVVSACIYYIKLINLTFEYYATLNLENLKIIRPKNWLT